MTEPEPVPLQASLTGPAGAPVLVLGNSLGTTSALWDAQAAVLGKRLRLLRFEHPGHGGAPLPPGPCTIEGLGRGVLALLDSHGIDAAAYCGVSLGGMIGMWLAAHAPGRVTALGLCCTSAHLPPAAGWHERAQLVRAEGTTAMSGSVVGRWFTPEFARREPAAVARTVAALEGEVDREGYARCCEAIAAMDQRASLASVRASTLVIAGSEDPATPPAHGAAIAAAIPGARLRVVRGAAHLANVSHAAEVTAAIAALLAGF